MNNSRKWILGVVRILVTAILLWWLFHLIDFEVMMRLFQEVSLSWIVVACLAILVARFFIALRWKILLTTYGLHLSLWDLNKIIFISMFAGNFLPGVIGTDLVRGYKVVKTHGQVGTVAMTLLLDRIVGVYSMMLVAVAGALVAEIAQRPTGLLNVVVVFSIGLVVAGGGILLVVGKLRSCQYFSGTCWASLWDRFVHLALNATELIRCRGTLTVLMTASVTVILVRCFVFFSLYQAFGVTLHFDAFLVFIPLMFVAVLIPISIGGLGVRETALVYLFRIVGAPTEVSASVGLMFHFLQILTSSPGLAFWLAERQQLKSATAEAGANRIGTVEDP